MLGRSCVERRRLFAGALASIATLASAGYTFANSSEGVAARLTITQTDGSDLANDPSKGLHKDVSNRPSLALAGKVSTVHIMVGTVPAAAKVTVSRAADLVGRPVDIFRPIPLYSSLDDKADPATVPSRMPLAKFALTSRFGMREHPILGVMREHLGVDLAAPIGTPVRATTDGTVRAADWNGGYGLFVALDEGNGLETRYGHMSRLNVHAGERVHRGEVIGFVGSTGLSTGPHLHYEVRVDGRAVNPLRRVKK